MNENENEEWRDVLTHVGIYQVSNLGRIKSIGNNKTKKDKILSIRKDNNGKFFVDLYKNSIKTRFKVHQLVAIYFLDHKIDGHNLVIDHIDGNGENNNVLNLQIVTNRENSTVCYRKDKESWSSKYIGVSLRKNGKYVARIKINGKDTYLGCFSNEIEASNAYITKRTEIDFLKYKQTISSLMIIKSTLCRQDR